MLTPAKKTKKKLIKRLTNTYRFILLRHESYEEKFSGTVTPIKIIFGSVILFFIFGVFFWGLYAHTPLKHSIPGYPHEQIVNADIINKLKADSLQRIAEKNDLYFRNLRAVLKGEEIEELSFTTDSVTGKTTLEEYQISEQDSLAREEIEQENNFDLTETSNTKERRFLEQLLLYKPAEGVISDGIDLELGHFGIDISAAKDSRVKSILDGTVIFSGFTASGGNEIHIQHSFELVSIYKHNSAVLKSTGEKVMAGESIAVVGNSGEHSDGTHLHFEMWQKGITLDPEDYFSY
ncbi:MAG: M23 family metallopeptidase [Flavobacteriales bacterium]